MRPIVLAAAASLVAVACTSNANTSDTAQPAAATLASPSEVAAVRQAVDSSNTRFQNALTGADTAALTAAYTDDAQLLPPNAKAAHGPDDIMKVWGGLFGAFTVQAASLKTDDLVVSGDYAIETGSYEMTLQPKGKTNSMKDTGKYIVVWKKQADGTWKMFRDIWNSDMPAAS
jgi:ketosteroid isomerase-like protein